MRFDTRRLISGVTGTYSQVQREVSGKKKTIHKPVILTFLKLLTETFLIELKPENRFVSPGYFPQSL